MDKISNLPDDIVSDILQRLPLIDRVRSSALSRSWRLKWTCISSLPLDDDFYFSVNRFTELPPWKYAKLINSLLVQHGSCIREFSLYLPDDYLSSFSLFESSIILATKSGSIETISFEADGYRSSLQPTLPSFIFLLVSLRHLYIIGFQLNPPSWFKGFPKLIRLELWSSNITTAVALSKFVSGCPQLEEVTFVGLRFARQVLELKAPKLRVLVLNGNFNDVIISNSPKLESVHIQMVGSYRKADVYVGKFKFLECFTQVKSMLLCGKICKVLGRCDDICMLPRFDRMKILNFHKMDSLDADNLKCVLSIISASPNIAVLYLSNFRRRRNEADDALEWMVKKYINDEYRYLTTIELFLKRGSEKTDMKIIEQFLRYSPVLMRMTIRFIFCADEIQLQLRTVILNFPRASNSVHIKFYKFGE